MQEFGADFKSKLGVNLLGAEDLGIKVSKSQVYACMCTVHVFRKLYSYMSEDNIIIILYSNICTYRTLKKIYCQLKM